MQTHYLRLVRLLAASPRMADEYSIILHSPVILFMLPMIVRHFA